MPRVAPRSGVWQDSARERTSGHRGQEGEPTEETIDREIARREGTDSGRHSRRYNFLMEFVDCLVSAPTILQQSE